MGLGRLAFGKVQETATRTDTPGTPRKSPGRRKGAGAFVISYDALYATGATYGVPAANAWIWPLLIDAPLIVFTIALLVSQIMRQSARLWAGLVILYTLATIGFNLSHAIPSPLGWTVAIVAPIGLLLTTEALRHLAKTIIERQAAIDTLADLVLPQRHEDVRRLVSGWWHSHAPSRQLIPVAQA